MPVIIDVDVVDMGIGLIQKSGLFGEEYKGCYRRTPTAKTIANFKVVWAEEYRIKKITTVTPGQMGCRMKSSTKQYIAGSLGAKNSDE